MLIYTYFSNILSMVPYVIVLKNGFKHYEKLFINPPPSSACQLSKRVIFDVFLACLMYLTHVQYRNVTVNSNSVFITRSMESEKGSIITSQSIETFTRHDRDIGRFFSQRYTWLNVCAEDRFSLRFVFCAHV